MAPKASVISCEASILCLKKSKKIPVLQKTVVARSLRNSKEKDIGGQCMRTTILFLLLVCLSSVDSFTLADSSLPASLEVKSSHGVSYLSGGVGEEEREALQLLGHTYTLKLVFAEKEGNYLSDVAINIRDHSGRDILDTVVDGPWLFALLPPGHYHVSATNHGVKRQQDVQVAAEQQRQLAFYW